MDAEIPAGDDFDTNYYDDMFYDDDTEETQDILLPVLLSLQPTGGSPMSASLQDDEADSDRNQAGRNLKILDFCKALLLHR